MIDVESRTGTTPAPVIASGLGRVPASMTITGALICRVPPSGTAISTVFGPVKRRPSMRTSMVAVSCGSRTRFVALALTHPQPLLMLVISRRTAQMFFTLN